LLQYKGNHEHKHKHDHGHSNDNAKLTQAEDVKDANEDQKHNHEHNHDHGHSHDHGEDCETCGPKLTSAEDVEDVEIPAWKKLALEKENNDDTSAAPFGMSWNTESTTSATDASSKN